MYPNLLGLKALHHLSNEAMGKIIGVHRDTFRCKLITGRFYPDECKALCQFFGKSFEYLFATEGDLKQDAEKPAAASEQ